jgi:hypothetical protein
MSRPEARRRPAMTPNAERTSEQAADARTRELIRRLLASTQEPASTRLGRLEEGVRAYEVDFRAFLNGQRRHPPLELAMVLDAAFRPPFAGTALPAVSRFAVEALKARFHAAQRLLTQRLSRAERPDAHVFAA